MNQWILITGASRGIGRATAIELATSGYNVVLTSRFEGNLNIVKAEIDSLAIPNCLVLVKTMDVRNETEINKVFQELIKEGILLSGVVNNAGIMKDATLQMAKKEDLLDMVNTNFIGTFLVSKAAIKHFIRLRSGSLVNIASIVGVHGNIGQTMYASTKSAVIGFTKSLSKELAPLNIRVNAIAPGFIETDMIKNMDERFYLKNVSGIGMKRLGQGTDIAKSVKFLLDDSSKYITGQVLGVDGGMVI